MDPVPGQCDGFDPGKILILVSLGASSKKYNRASGDQGGGGLLLLSIALKPQSLKKITAQFAANFLVLALNFRVPVKKL
jgi:hypothetical protein